MGIRVTDTRRPWWRLGRPYTGQNGRSGAIAPPPAPRPVYGDETLRDQVATTIAIAAASPEPRHLPGGPH